MVFIPLSLRLNLCISDVPPNIDVSKAVNLLLFKRLKKQNKILLYVLNKNPLALEQYTIYTIVDLFSKNGFLRAI